MRKKSKLLLKGFQRIYLLTICALISLGVSAQSTRSISGTVVDEFGEPVIGASVVVKGTTSGTATDIDGKFQLNVANNAILVVSYIGYAAQEIPAGTSPMRIVLKEDALMLEELVVIGYGSMKKGDLTGSITSVGEKSFQKGLVTNPTSLITGKVAGVQITSTGGRAGGGNQIRIRGGASLSASNDPLIVVDGVPLDNESIAGVTNPLSTINPNDIESMNILKDASATAIYGSRASNGVIIITTKKGATGQKLRVEASTQNSIATIARRVDVLSANEFREMITTQATNRFDADKAARYIGYMGNANTDWQDEIFRNAFTTDNNISVSGAAGILPYRASAGFISQDGILDTDNMKRGTFALNLSPKFFDNHLSVTVNLKGTYTHSRFGNSGAIGAALRMDPTKPVTANGFDKFNDYWQWISGDGVNRNTMGTSNPVSLLHGLDDQSDVLRSIGNIQFDYKFHFLPDLRANLNLGYDVSQGKGDRITQPWSPARYPSGERSQFDQRKQNKLLEFYLNYTKQLNEANRVEVMGGYTWQDWLTKDKSFPVYEYDGKTIREEAGIRIPQQNRLISFYGRLNYNLLEKYMVTATIRRDGSSRFSPKNRWGTFPSVALAWRINEESFMKDIEVLSNLKLRLGWGVTGQQGFSNNTSGNFGWLPIYLQSDLTSQVQFGDQFYQSWRPEGYDSERKWEQTATKNIGLDWGFVNNRVNGSIDYYQKHTTDLLNQVPVPAGSNFTPSMVRNIGTMDNWGIEGNIEVVAIESKDIHWDIGFNITYNNTEISKLSLNDGPDSDYKGALVGGISGGTGNTVQIHKVGYAPNSFYVYRQVYDESGKPIEGIYEDINGDGVVNDQDLYLYKKAAPDLFLGFNTTFNYKRWSLATALRASFGNYVYNNVNSDLGNFSQTLNPNDFIMNNVVNGLYTGFYDRQLLSDYYVQNASFLKMDYLQLGYDFGKVLSGKASLRANATIQNVFTMTEYDGIDPEMANGIDNNFYPNPRTFSLGLILNF